MKYPNDRERDPYEEETNKEKYDLIRQVICSCSSLLHNIYRNKNSTCETHPNVYGRFGMSMKTFFHSLKVT